MLIKEKVSLKDEADEIRAHGNIIAYEKQAKEKILTTLTEGQIDNITNELQKKSTAQ